MSMVDHPKHYNMGDIECIDAMISAFGKSEVAIWCKINAFKYLWRMDYKDSFFDDLGKTQWYINKLKELISDEQK